jgi:hypothetical protein
MSGLPSQHEEAHSTTRLAEKSRRRAESGDGFSLRAHTTPLSPHGVKKQSAGAPAFDAINWMTFPFAQFID